MKAITPVNPKKCNKNIRYILFFLSIYILLHCFSYAGYTPTFDPATGKMEITTTDGEDITITKDPITGGLAINGT